MCSLVAAHRLDERMDGTTVLEVATQTDGQVVETTEFATDSKQVGHRLRGVRVSAVACVDNRDTTELACHTRGTLFVVAHGDDVGKR